MHFPSLFRLSFAWVLADLVQLFPLFWSLAPSSPFCLCHFTQHLSCFHESFASMFGAFVWLRMTPLGRLWMQPGSQIYSVAPNRPCPTSSAPKSHSFACRMWCFRSCLNFVTCNPHLDLHTLSKPSSPWFTSSFTPIWGPPPRNRSSCTMGIVIPTDWWILCSVLPLLYYIYLILFSCFTQAFLCMLIITINLFQIVNVIQGLKDWTLELTSLPSSAECTL